MFLRNARLTVTDFDIMLYLYKSSRRVADLVEFLAACSSKNAHTYLYRLKRKGYIQKKERSIYELTPRGRELIERLKNDVL